MIKEAINNDAWAIMPSSLDNISSKVIEGVVDPVISEISEDASNDRASYIEARAAFMSQFEEKLQVDEDGTGYISIDGPMMLNPGPFERMVIGAADMGRISELVRVAAGEEEINSLVLNINSPGGTVVGTPELAQSIRDFNATGKKSVAFTNSLMASAAYWVGSQCSEVVCTESAIVGSVGVIRAHVDLTEARAQAGVKVEVFRGGDNKVAGAYSTEMTDEQRELIQEGIDEKHAEFQAVVNKARSIDVSLLDGRTFYGKQAAENGFADVVADSLGGALVRVKSDDYMSEENNSTNNKVDNQGKDMSNPAENNESAPEAEIAEGEVAISEAVAQEQAEEFVSIENTAEEASEEVAEEVIEASEDSAEGCDKEDCEDCEGCDKEESSEERAEEQVEEHAEEQVEWQSIEDRVEALSAKLDAVIEALKGSGESKEKAEEQSEEQSEEQAEEQSFEERVEEAAEAKAAKIAADSGVDSIEASEEGDSETAKYANFTDAELWVEHSKIRAEKGEAAARVFYTNQIRNR